MDERKPSKNKLVFTTKDQKATFNILLKIIETDFFKEQQEVTRKLLKIPPEGKPKKEMVFLGWGDEAMTAIREDSFVYNICNKFHLPYYWGSVLTLFIYENSPRVNKKQLLGTMGLCITWDVIEEDFSVTDDMAKDIIEEINKFNQFYPIAIRITSDTTEREILDYVRKNYTKQIKPLQEKYKAKGYSLGKVRTRDPKIRKLYDYIYSLRDSSRKEIADKVSDHFGVFIDEGHIGKIISIERKRRSEV